MNQSTNTSIAGSKTVADWQALRPLLLGPASPAVWEYVFEEYLNTRLTLRYFNPIKVLQENDTCQGEGFSITAIQCTLIEFLESLRKGMKYRLLRTGEKLDSYEYASSKDMFISFLCNRHPFQDIFNNDSAYDFYASVRCGLIHEAQTKNNWKIWAESLSDIVVDVEKRIVYRNNFQKALLSYIESYKNALLTDTDIQLALIRKFDSLCEAWP